MLIILILLLAIGYAARAFDSDSRTGSHPVGWHPGSQLIGLAWPPAQPGSVAQDGGRLAAKAAMPSCACGLAK